MDTSTQFLNITSEHNLVALPGVTPGSLFAEYLETTPTSSSRPEKREAEPAAAAPLDTTTAGGFGSPPFACWTPEAKER